MAAAGGYVGPPDVPEDSVPVKFSEGGWLPGGTVQILLDPDECLISAQDVRAMRWRCSRPGHPTSTSDCAIRSSDAD